MTIGPSSALSTPLPYAIPALATMSTEFEYPLTRTDVYFSRLTLYSSDSINPTGGFADDHSRGLCSLSIQPPMDSTHR